VPRNGADSHLQDQVGEHLRLRLGLRFLQLLLHGRVAAHSDVRLAEVFAIGKPPCLLTRRQRRRCRHREARLPGELRDGVRLRAEDAGIAARLLIVARVRC